MNEIWVAPRHPLALCQPACFALFRGTVVTSKLKNDDDDEDRRMLCIKQKKIGTRELSVWFFIRVLERLKNVSVIIKPYAYI
jgi:hypothetical protein